MARGLPAESSTQTGHEGGLLLPVEERNAPADAGAEEFSSIWRKTITTTKEQIMNYVQDPYKQVSYLQQCLSSDKKPLGLFLGAGCPVAVRIGDDKRTPLIPDIAGITEVVRGKLSEDKETKPLLNIMDRHFKEDGRNDISVEDMLSHIRALRVVAGNAKVRDLSAEDLDKLDADICQIIHELADKTLPSNETPYHNTAVWTDAAAREMPVEIFTTNYDLLMEQAFEDSRVPYFDGFAGSRKPFFDLRAMEEDHLPARWARVVGRGRCHRRRQPGQVRCGLGGHPRGHGPAPTVHPVRCGPRLR